MTAERNVCEAQRTQVNSNLAGLGASTFPARTASSRERGKQAHAEGIAALLADLPPARLATVEPHRQPSPRAGQAREEKGDGAVHRPLVGCSHMMAGMQETCRSGCDPGPLPAAQGTDPDLPLTPGLANSSAGHWDPSVTVSTEPKYSPCWFQRRR